MPKIVDHAARRTEIAHAVLTVIAEGGMPAVTLRGVAAAASVSMGRVQHYFASKEELIHEACRTVVAMAADDFSRLENAPVRERLRHLVLAPIPDGPGSRIGTSMWFTFVAAGFSDPALAEIIRDAWNVAELIAQLLAEAGVAEPERNAVILSAASDGVVLRVLLGSLSPTQAREILTDHLEALLSSKH